MKLSPAPIVSFMVSSGRAGTDNFILSYTQLCLKWKLLNYKYWHNFIPSCAELEIVMLKLLLDKSPIFASTKAQDTSEDTIEDISLSIFHWLSAMASANIRELILV